MAQGRFRIRTRVFGLVYAGLAAAGVVSAYADPGDMVDPALDADGPFAYLAKSSTTIGVMGGPEGSQVTFDGVIYTGHAELCFFYGQPLRPVMVRQKTLLDGWIPVVQYGWRDGPVEYGIETFGATLDGVPTSNTINFVQVTLRNQGTEAAAATFAAALRYSGEDHRCPALATVPFSPTWRYEMTDDCIARQGQVLCLFPPGARRQAVPGVDYAAPFVGRELDVSERVEFGLVQYAVDLAPGGTRTLVFKMPLVPVKSDDAPQLEAIRQAAYARFRQQTLDGWQAELAKGVQISVPEEKVVHTFRASLMYDLMAIDQEGGAWVQKVNELHYDHFWLRDGAYIVRTYDLLGHHATAARCLEHFRKFQQADGLFLSQPGQLDGFGQGLFALGQHALITGDVEYAQRVYPHFPPAVRWLKEARAQDAHHLLPPTAARDNELIEGRYTGHNFWALLGVRTAVLLARMTGHTDDAQAFLAEYDDYRKALLQRVEEVCGRDGYIPPGLDVAGGTDWGNLLGVYPSAVLEAFDPRVTTTLKKMHDERYQEGIMTYNGLLHHYLTVNVSQTHVVRGEQQQALTDFYHLLLHTGSAHEGFEFQAAPWGDRDTHGNYPPHGWCAAQMNALLRNMLVQERGGDGGLGPRDLHLFSVLSPAWVVPGREVAIRNAPTEMGPISAVLKFTEGGAEMRFEGRFRTPPANLVLHLPFFVTLASFDSDAQAARREPDAIVLSPDVTTVTLRWARHPGTPTSYAAVVDAYKSEYARRYATYVAEGRKPLPVEAPKLLTADERRAEFARRWGPAVVGIAVGKPVTASGGTEAGHGPELAVDGNARDRDGSSWWAGPPTPRTLTIDLQVPVKIGKVHVYPYWDGQRYYQYTVELSPDGEHWRQVVDFTGNMAPATEKGDVHMIDSVEGRYVRVNLLHNSANTSVHLVEVRVFAVP